VDEEETEEEEFALDEIYFSVSDYMLRAKASNFIGAWDHMGEEGQAVTTFSLSTVSTIPRVSRFCFPSSPLFEMY
jgi:hypothetical protein